MLPELPKSQATGGIADIYDDIRRFSGVPYVSSLQRYLATLPGVLEWAWAALRPAMESGVIPETGWRLASDVRVTPAAPVPLATLRRWGVDAAGLTAIRNIAANLVHVFAGEPRDRRLSEPASYARLHPVQVFPQACGHRLGCCRRCRATSIRPICRSRSAPC